MQAKMQKATGLGWLCSGSNLQGILLRIQRVYKFLRQRTLDDCIMLAIQPKCERESRPFHILLWHE